MRSPPRARLGVAGLAVLCASLAFALARAEDDVSFKDDLELLRAQMRLRALSQLHERGFYVPLDVFREYQEAHRALEEKLHGAKTHDLALTEPWANEAKKVAEAEANEVQKLVEKHGKKLLKEASKTVDELRKFEEECAAWRRDRRAKAAWLEKTIGWMHKTRLREARGQPFEESFRAIYRGSLEAQKDLYQGVVELEKKRRTIEAARSILSELTTTVDWISDQEKATKERIKAKIDAKLVEYLKSIDSQVDAKVIEGVTAKIQKVGEKALAAREKIQAVDDDPSMNPTVRGAAKRFVVLGALWDVTLGFISELDEWKALGPIGDFCEYYGKTIELVPTIAKKVSAATARVDQDLQGARRLSEFADLPSDAGLFAMGSLTKQFGGRVKVGYDARWAREEQADALHLIVPKTVVPRGWATLSARDHARLARALADERILNAPGEASSGLAERAWDFAFGRSVGASVFSPTVSQDYRASLSKAARTTPYAEKPEELLALARDDGGQATRLANSREARVSSLAEEAAIVAALGDFKESDRQEWRAFCDTLTASGVRFPPEQIVALFGYHVRGGDRAILARFLEGEKKRRAKNRQGAPRVGVVSVGAGALDQIRPGSTMTLSANVIVSHLEAEKTVKARATWTLPSWAKPAKVEQDVTLGNGVTVLRCPLAAPKELETGALVELDLRTEDASVSAHASGWLELDKELVPRAPVVREELDGKKVKHVVVECERSPESPDETRPQGVAVLRGDAASGPWREVGRSRGGVVIDADVKPGKTYHYVQAYVWKKAGLESVGTPSEPAKLETTRAPAKVVMKLSHMDWDSRTWDQKEHRSGKNAPPQKSFSWGFKRTWNGGHATFQGQVTVSVPDEVPLDDEGKADTEVTAHVEVSWEAAGMGSKKPDTELNFSFDYGGGGTEQSVKKLPGRLGDGQLTASADVKSVQSFRYFKSAETYRGQGVGVYASHIEGTNFSVTYYYKAVVQEK